MKGIRSVTPVADRRKASGQTWRMASERKHATRVYESDFLGFSYGFRPQRSQHMALDALAAAIRRKVNWVLDADIRDYFGTIDHAWLMKLVEHRIADRRVLRLIQIWLRAGVMENGTRMESREGTPQPQ